MLSRISRALLSCIGLWSAVWPVEAQLPTLDATRAKNLGIAYLEQEKPREAARMFREVTQLLPDEPLGYANLAACYLRLSLADSAHLLLDQAIARDPGNAQVLYLMSEAHGAESNWSQAVAALNQAVTNAPEDPVLRYARFRTIQSLSTDSLRSVAADDINALSRLVPNNAAVGVKQARFHAETGNLVAAKARFEALSPLLKDAAVPERVIALIEKSLADGNTQLAVRAFTVLENVLRPSERYKQSLEALQNPVIGLPLLRFRDAVHSRVRREAPTEISVNWHRHGSVVSLDASGKLGSLDFADVNGDGIEDWVVSIGGRKGTTQLWVSDQGRRTRLWGGKSSTLTRFLDYDNDGRFDLLSVSGNGPRLVRRDSTGQYADVSAVSQLSGPALSAATVVDFDNEGDLDLVFSGADGLHAWQNRMDGTFRNVDERVGLEGVRAVRKIIPIDHDDDDDPDLLVIDGEGRLHLFDNLRLSRYARIDRGLGTGTFKDAAPVDFDNDGWIDFAALTGDGRLVIKRWNNNVYAAEVTLHAGPFDRLETADYDNDGWSDLVVSRAGSIRVFRNGGQGEWEERAVGKIDRDLLAMGWSDVENDGDLDLVVLGGGGTVSVFENQGGNENAWLRISLVGLQTRGTKNNLHGFGSRIEVKAGLHYQVKYADRPVTHFGLGSRAGADLVRVTWSNGVPQNVFEPSVNQTLREKQVLKGSCPYLYAWDGERFRFVTDLLGGAPLGLQLADGVIAPDNPREIVKVDADYLREKDGAFTFQFTEELWETIYLDEVGLWVVDHPEHTEAFTDERFLPPPYEEPQVVITNGRIYPTRATNTAGETVTDKLVAYDYAFPNALTPTRYQGIVEPHSVTMAFGDVSRLDHPTLVMRGWIFWSDTSINVAMSQGEAVRPEFPLVDVWRDGGWVTLDRPFGLPKGKDKWMVLDLKGQIEPNDARVRIRTNYEIYYDLAFLSDALDESETRVTRLSPVKADLHYGGFSEMVRMTPESPHHYDYQRKVTFPVWKDMSGMVTRYGDVTELLSATDDAMVVFTAGDEVTCRFDAAALPALAEGMTRSFFFLSDGWDKDADRNTVTGETVLPLPFHGMSAYPYPDQKVFPDEDAHRRMRELLTRKIGPELYRDYVRQVRFSEKPEPLPWENTKGVAEGGVR